MIKNILLTTFVFISLHHLIPAQEQEDPESLKTLNFRKEQLLAESSKCTDKNNLFTCVQTSGCCWVDIVTNDESIKGCFWTSRDESDVCDNLNTGMGKAGYTKVSFFC